mgnify:CR=1 FL=1
MNTIVETKDRKENLKLEVTLPQDLNTEEKIVSVKQVYNLDFSKHAVKTLTNLHKQVGKGIYWRRKSTS